MNLSAVQERVKLKRKNAKFRGLVCELELGLAFNILNQRSCAYSGLPFENDLTLERIDNNKGYIPGNVIAVKSEYNHLRSNHTVETIPATIENLKLKLVSHLETKPVKPRWNYAHQTQRKLSKFKNTGLKLGIKFDWSTIEKSANFDKSLQAELSTVVDNFKKSMQAWADKKLATETLIEKYDTILKNLVIYSNLSPRQLDRVKVGVDINSTQSEYLEAVLRVKIISEVT